MGRDRKLTILEVLASGAFRPRGGYYVMTDISTFRFPDDMSFTRHLIQDIGVATVRGSSFYRDPNLGSQQVRFCSARWTPQWTMLSITSRS